MARKPAGVWSNLLRSLELIMQKLTVLQAKSAAIRGANHGGVVGPLAPLVVVVVLVVVDVELLGLLVLALV